ncbi:YggS family pyridoxal phosphate-dependent enzyme [bacterium]|nr:YggS family pyridoxal phosphate-dependent enzyme [bacterium]
MTAPGTPPRDGATLVERTAWVRDRIADAVRRSGRPAGSVKLVAVSKTRPIEQVLEAHAAGLSVFGENYVQEAEGKIPGLPGAEWHLIGRLQGNKVRRAVALFPWIQTADSAGRLREISRCAAESGKTARVLIEVNLGGEGSKAGADPGDLRAILDASAALPGVRVEGLMAIPPISADPEGSRPHFARLRDLRDALARDLPGTDLGELSMGMSNDFVQAIEEGATMVRIGTAIFGSRQGRG